MQTKNEENAGIRLLKKSKKGLVRAIFGRLGVILILMALQVGIFLGAFYYFIDIFPQLWGCSIAFSVCMVLYLVNSRLDPTAKITWLIVIMLMPIFGALLFWFTQSELGHRATKQRIDQLIRQSGPLFPASQESLEHLKQASPGAANLATYINRNQCHPVYENTQVTYFPIGEAKWEELLRQLEQAEKFIFLEYFIIDEGLMWGKVLDVLARKAKQGVQVRVMYDGTCEFTTLPHKYPKLLRELGIECRMFAPVVPLLSTYYNYRDHRKILVIDGHTAFSGGVNLADEYINHIDRFGHWKDTAVMLKGEAVRSFTLMFLQMWNISEKDADFAPYLATPCPTAQEKGFVVPYGDCPLDADKVGERVYMDILNRAERYVYIMTPYLILDGEMETALKFAAERGVEVKLILPGIPDKKAPYALAKSHYASLLDSGVQIYEYTPGFVHAKVFLSDDREAVVGTINLDYRSLYHHFECAVWMYDTPCIPDISDDFQQTLTKCRRVTPDTIWQGYTYLKPVSAIVKVVAPLL